ncbi:DUF362 domain-containing protein [candidate division KSB1 bacterium]|nr:DUF362 domain-containing protein [candidate division KSB1 bacterium]
MKRRTFIKHAATIGAAAVINPVDIFGEIFRGNSGYFRIHPFIENNPDAVFIMKTDVQQKSDSTAIKQIGLEFGRTVFLGSDAAENRVPLTHNIVIKPNLTRRYRENPQYTIEGTMGIVTDSSFIEGIIESMKELGLAGNQFYLREVNCDDIEWEHGGFWDVCERTGADLQNFDINIEDMDPENVHWVDVPDGIYFNRLPYVAPVNTPDSWLLNIAKFKAHGMGLTLCAKNLQGTIVKEYQGHCRSLSSYVRKQGISKDNIRPTAESDVQNNYERHKSDIPRWDKPNGPLSGQRMETWATRCLDNNSVTKPGLHIIEGIYGRNGNFINGPHASDGSIDLNNKNNLAKDFLSNILIFGKNPFYVDIVGHWLGGHEPGNIGLFHVAMERGFIDYLNPMDIPVYEWKSDGSAIKTPLTNFEKTPLVTYYLQRNYDGQDESYWHLMDEPFDYSKFSKVNVAQKNAEKPGTFILAQNYPNPFNNSTSIQYSIPKNGHVRIDVINSSGQVVDQLVNRFHAGGNYMVNWNTAHVASGTYFYRFSYDGFHEVKKMVLLR